ncbi:hypothetical protein D3C78_792420 [compost metagenome]
MLVGRTHTGAVVHVFLGDRHLGVGVVLGVPGQAQFFVQHPQGIVADIQCLVGLVGLGLQVRLVAATGIQVETHAQHRLPLVTVAILAVNVVVGGAPQFRIETWVEGRFGRVVLLLGRHDVRLGRAQDRAVFQHLLAGFIQVGWQHRHKRRGTL